MSSPAIPKGMSKQEVAAFVDSVVAKLSLREKVSLMSGHRTNVWRLIWTTLAFRQINRYPVPAGGLKRLGIPPILFSDGPRGVVLGNSTCFPVAMARAATWDPALEERIGQAIAREVRAQGGNYFAGVCINLLRHPAWGRAQETYGEDPYLLGEMGAALVRGVQHHNVMACIKHFALNSIERSRYRVDVRVDERSLREVYLPHFKRCIDAGAASVMGAYNRFRGEFCCQNRTLLTTILRDEWRFDGFTSSDWIQGVRDTELAAEAGMDIEMPWPKFYGGRLLRAVRNGSVLPEIIDRAATRILRKTVEFASAEDPESYDRSVVGCPAHGELALEAALKSAVLLKNENDTLPFSSNDVSRLAVIGRLAAVENTGDMGSSKVIPPYTITPWQGLSDYLGHQAEVIHSNGSSLEEACRVASQADAVVLVVGYDYRDEGEGIGDWWPNGNDRDSLYLHSDEEELIKAVAQCNRRCAVVLIGGSAIIVEPWVHLVPAVLMTWYSGQEGGTALARILFGDTNPSGKLPFTVPKEPGDLPFFDADADSIEYGFHHGYSLFDAKAIEPAFAFGHGLGYTSFAYAGLRLDRQTIGPQESVGISVDVSNVGDRSGDEIVQVYVSCEDSSVERHPKDLKSFRRVTLEPGETRIVRFSLPADQLAYYDPGEKRWIVEPIEYVVLVGPSSRDANLLKDRFRVTF